jgi:hypothetical protein
VTAPRSARSCRARAARPVGAVWQPDRATAARLMRPFGLLAIAGRNSYKAEAWGRNQPLLFTPFFYFQKINFYLNIPKSSIIFQDA